MALLFQGLGSRLIDRYVQRVGESTNHGFTKCAVRQEAGFTGGYREGARASSWVRELPNLETTAPSRFLNPSSPEGNPKTNFTPSRKRGDTSRFLMHPCIVAFRISSCTALRNPIPTVASLFFSTPLLLLLLPAQSTGNRVGDNAATGGELTCCLSPHNLCPCRPSRSTPLAGSPAPYFPSLPPSPAPGDAPIWGGGASSTQISRCACHDQRSQSIRRQISIFSGAGGRCRR